MSLQFIFGSSGSGKTFYLYKDLIKQSENDRETNFIAIVPEQFTMQTQKDMVLLHPNRGVMNIDIVSFQRLAYRVFEELALESLAVLDDMGKSMILRKVAAGKKKDLVIFSGHLQKTGFISQLKSMLSELYQYGIGLEELEQLAEDTSLNPLLSRKLKDLSIVYRSFKEYLQDKYITTEEILDVLCQVLSRSEIIKNSVITLDGYTGFTPIQYRLLELLLIYAKKVTVAVTIDTRENPYLVGSNHQLFYMSKYTIKRLSQLAAEHKIFKEKDINLSGKPSYRFIGSEPLDFLEQEFLRFHNCVYEKEQDKILIYMALNPMKEIQFVIKEITKLIREGGYRYKDMAVITGDLEGYGKVIKHQFDRCDIPYFLDSKKSIISNPMVEFIRAALEVIEKDFSYESIFRYLKTGMVSIDREDSSRLENYVIALGIRGHKRWSRTWEMTFRGSERYNLERLNELRTFISRPLLELRSVCKGKDITVKDMTQGVVSLLSSLGIQRKMSEFEEEFRNHSDFSLAGEYSQAYGLVIELLDKIVDLLGDEVLKISEYNDILDTGFQEIKVGLIPACIDRIVVGNIERTRLNHVKVLFFVGVNDGVVPSTSEKGGILSDLDREYLERFQIELAPTPKQDGYMQRFYLYLMMTKPSDKLYISYTSVSGGGKSLRPSFLIGTIRNLFPKLGIIDEAELDPLGEIGTKVDAWEKLAIGLRSLPEAEPENRFMELYRWFYGHLEAREQLDRLVDAAFYSYEEKGISQAAAKAIYGDILSGSVTRLEKYAACAYAHFLIYGLELMERREFQLASVDLGNIFHSSIDLFFKRMHQEGRNWTELSKEDREILVKDCVAEVTALYGNTILQSSARNAYLAGKIERITDRTIWALGEQMKKGDFTPVGFEVSFSAADNLKAAKIALSEEESMQLKGRIDRLDLCEDEKHVYIKIIDYKSGSTSFDLAALYYGLQLQLVVYMDAVMELEQRKHPEKAVVPAGIFYYNIDDPIVDKQVGMNEEDIQHEILRQLQMNGLVNSDLEVIRHLDHTIESESDVIPVVMKSGAINKARSSVAGTESFNELKIFVNEKLKLMGREILDGQVSVNPYKRGQKTACEYCQFQSVCGFDLKCSGYNYRQFKTFKSDEFWQAIEGGKKK